MLRTFLGAPVIRSFSPIVLFALFICGSASALTLKYDHIKKPGAKTIVLIHGADSNRHTFDNVIGPLSQHFDLIIVDLPGHGESELLDDNSFESMDGALEELLATLKVKAAYFLGHSFGARVVMAFAERHAEVVLGIVIEDMDLLQRAPAPTHEHQNAQLAFKAWAAAADFTAALKRLWTPILVLEAAHESGITQAGRTHLLEHANWCNIELIDGSTHNIHKSAPTLFLKSVIGFVNSVSKDNLLGGRLPIQIWKAIFARLSLVESFTLLRPLSRAMRYAFDSGAIFALTTHGYQLVDYLRMLNEIANAPLCPAAKARLISFIENRREEILRNIYGRDYFAHINDRLQVGRREITQFEWALVTGRNPSRLAQFAQTGTLVLNGATILPARALDNVSLDDILRVFIPILADLGIRIRLTTEAEWRDYAEPSLELQDHFDTLAWHDQNAGNEVHDVGELAPNRFGLFDVFGNVAEIVEAGANQIVARGGYYASTLLACLVGRVLIAATASRSEFIGFRVARDFSKL